MTGGRGHHKTSKYQRLRKRAATNNSTREERAVDSKEQNQMFFDDDNSAHLEQRTVSLKAEDPSEDGGQETGDGVNEEDRQGQSLELEEDATTTTAPAEENSAVPWWKCAQPGHHQSPHNTAVAAKLQKRMVNSKVTSQKTPDAVDDSDSSEDVEQIEVTCEKSNSEGASHKKGSGSIDGVHTSTDDDSDVEEEEDLNEDSGTSHNNNKPFSEVELLHKLVAAHDTIDRQRAIIKRQRQEIKELKKANNKKQKK